MLYEYYESGQVKREIHYEDGNQTGIIKTYYENGVLNTEGNYLNGVLNGYYNNYNVNKHYINRIFHDRTFYR